jgi:hypothetical protein
MAVTVTANRSPSPVRRPDSIGGSVFLFSALDSPARAVSTAGNFLIT